MKDEIRQLQFKQLLPMTGFGRNDIFKIPVVKTGILNHEL